MPKQSNLERLTRGEFKGRTEWKVSPKLGADLPYAESEREWFFNKKGTDIIYVQPKQPADAKAYCYACKTPILVKQQQVTEWTDIVGPCSGGDTQLEYVKYCPTCEQEPQTTRIKVVP